MKEIKKDLFECLLDPSVDAICITTNGQYLTNGQACMGGGCAGVCARLWPETSLRLGTLLKYTKQNVPFIIGAVDANDNYIEPTFDIVKNKKFKALIFSFPTINNLWDGANLDLIVKSATILVEHVNKCGLQNIVSARFGSGIGGLDWHQEVKPLVENILDDRFTIVSFDHED